MRTHSPLLSRLTVLVGTLLLVLVAAAGTATAAGAQEGTGNCPDGRPVIDTQVYVSGGPLVIEPCTHVDGAVIAGDTDVIIGLHASVDGAVIVANGTAVIRGKVTGDVVVLRGRAVVEGTGTVEGNVVSSQAAQIDDGATVGGSVERVRFTEIISALGIAVRIFWWIAVSASTLVAGLAFTGAFRGMAERTVRTGRESVGPSIATGAAVSIGLPVAASILLATLIFSPLGLTGLFALAPLYLVGYVAGALFLGSMILQGRRGPVLAFTLGWLILRVLSVVPFVGVFFTLAATLYGLGALLVAAWHLTRPAGSADGDGGDGYAGEPADDGDLFAASSPTSAPEPVAAPAITDDDTEAEAEVEAADR